MQKDSQVIHKLKRISLISLLFMSVQIIGGIMANSIAILADAFHLLSDVLAYMISLQAVLMSHKKAPSYMTFGYQKMQPLGALINVGIIWFVTIELVIEATQRVLNYSIVQQPLYMLLTSFFGLGCNLVIMNTLHSDTQHGGHHGCSHDHGHTHGDKHIHQDKHTHTHGNKMCNHNHQNQHKHQHQHNKNIKQNKCNHNHNHNDHHHNRNHQNNHNQNNHEHNHHHEHTDKCSHNHSHEQPSPPFCDINHDHVQDSHNCNSKGYSKLSKESLSQEIFQFSEKPIALAPDHNISDENLKHMQKQKARREYFENINIQAAYIHIISDIILSIGVIISALVIYFFADRDHWSYWQLADPLCTYLFSVMAIYSTWKVAKDSILILLDGCDDKQIINNVTRQLDALPNMEYENLRVWSINHRKYNGAVKIKIGESDSNKIKQKVKRIFDNMQIVSYIDVEEQSNQLKSE